MGLIRKSSTKLVACYDGFIGNLPDSGIVRIDVEVLPGQDYSISVDRNLLPVDSYQGMAITFNLYEDKPDPVIEKRYLSNEEQEKITKLKEEINKLMEEF